MRPRFLARLVANEGLADVSLAVYLVSALFKFSGRFSAIRDFTAYFMA